MVLIIVIFIIAVLQYIAQL